MDDICNVKMCKVNFYKWCGKCYFWDHSFLEEPCCECNEVRTNLNSDKPVKFSESGVTKTIKNIMLL